MHNTNNFIKILIFIIVILSLINIYSLIYNILKNDINDVSNKVPYNCIIIENNNNHNVMVLCRNN